MKIKIPAKTPSSNKPLFTSKTSHGQPASQPSYQHELKPHIDWISITVTPPDEDQHDIHNAFWTAVNDKDLLEDATSAEKKGIGGGFNIAKRIVLPSITVEKKRPTLFLRHVKDKKRIAKLRLNLVPVDLGPDGILDLHVAIGMIVPDGWEYVMKYGRVTRIDVAVDLPDLTMDSIHLLPKKASYSRLLFPNGQVETIYLGKPKSSQTVFYDRSKKRSNQKQEVPQSLRIERRVKPDNIKLANLATMKNPLSGTKLFIALPGPPNPAKEWEWSLFSDSVEKRGLSAALALLPKDRRTIYKKHLDAKLLPAWNPEKIWSGWKPMLDELKIASTEW